MIAFPDRETRVRRNIGFAEAPPADPAVIFQKGIDRIQRTRCRGTVEVDAFPAEGDGSRVRLRLRKGRIGKDALCRPNGADEEGGTSLICSLRDDRKTGSRYFCQVFREFARGSMQNLCGLIRQNDPIRGFPFVCNREFLTGG